MLIKKIPYKLMFILSALLFAIAMLSLIFNPFRLGNTEVVDSRIEYINNDGTIGYSFVVNNEKIVGEVKSDYLLDINVGDIISVRYLIKNPIKNAINIYECIYYKEWNMCLLSIVLTSFGISYLVVSSMFSNNKDEILNEIENGKKTDVNRQRNTLYGSIALIGCLILLLGMYFLTMGMEGIAIGVLFIMSGMLLIGNYVFFIHKSK